MLNIHPYHNFNHLPSFLNIFTNTQNFRLLDGTSIEVSGLPPAGPLKMLYSKYKVSVTSPSPSAQPGQVTESLYLEQRSGPLLVRDTSPALSHREQDRWLRSYCVVD